MTLSTEVLVVGAGPSGLALAAALQRHGVAARIIDRHRDAAQTSRACVIHARTLEVLEPLGVTTELLAVGVKVPIFRIRDRDRTLVTIDFSEIESDYPFTLMYPQDRTERLLLGALERVGGSVERPVELASFEASTGGVSATLKAEQGTDIVESQWLVGCDGMHSVVREHAGIAFEGAAYEQGFVLADVSMSWPLSREEVSLFYSPQGLVVVAPLPDDRFRIVATDDDAPESPSKEYVQSLLDARGPVIDPARVHELAWSSRFRIHHRVASTPRRGQILLCGDAAHVHSPAGGQGMNTGIQDAMSPAPVLTRVIRGADPAALDRWAAERHRIAVDVVAMTDRMSKGGDADVAAGPVAAQRRSGAPRPRAAGSRRPGATPGRARYALRRIGMTDRVAVFNEHRPRLYGIAYRMLGTRADAEDMVQEAYLRWHRVDAERLQAPEAWLITATTRLCIDRLRAARTEREAYVGPWLPEPITGIGVAPPADAQSELASDLSVAFLVVLERLAPEERAAFLLHEVFDSAYADIAGILGKNEATCRQIVHRARQRVHQDRPRFKVSDAARGRLLERFVEALRTEDQAELLALFAADATWTSDGGGKAKAARKVVRGAELVARFTRGIWRRYAKDMTYRLTIINGEAGLVACDDQGPAWVLTIETDGVRILAAYSLVNPDKLKGIPSLESIRAI